MNKYLEETEDLNKEYPDPERPPAKKNKHLKQL